MRILVLAVATLLLAGCAGAEQAAPETKASETTSTQPSASPSQSEDTEEAPLEDEPQSQQSVEEPSPSQSESESEPEASRGAAGEDAEPEPEPSESQAAAEPTEESAPQPTIVGYTLAEVAENASAESCWVAIDGGVYDLTMWVRSHPGGSGAILQLCGTDGTQMFLGQHGGQARPASTLDGYYIGPLR